MAQPQPQNPAALQQPQPAPQVPPVPTIIDWAQAYNVPVIPALPLPTTSLPPNTTNTIYEVTTVETIVPWIINQADLNVYNIVFTQAYDHTNPPPNRPAHATHLTPLDQTLSHPVAQCDKEYSVTSRLDRLVFQDLERVLAYISLFPLPPNHSPLFSDVGTTAQLYKRPGKRGEFTPDRCAVVDLAVKGPNMCPGDIKPSWKFRSEWRNYAQVANMNAMNATVNSWFRAYKEVVAQVKFYIRMCGAVPNPADHAAKYGYVVTDREVVLLKRDPQVPNAIHVSDGFPLRGLGAGPGVINGMVALIYIHLLAGDNFQGICNSAV